MPCALIVSGWRAVLSSAAGNIIVIESVKQLISCIS